MDANFLPVVSEQTFDVSVDVVWNAITDPDQMRQWFFEPMTDFKPEVGFETQFNVHCDGQDYLHLWKITDVIPKQRIVYDWRYGGYSGRSLVIWELSETSAGSKLSLSHQGIETFPQDNPAFSRESTQGGWDYFLQESLKNFLNPKTS